MKRKNIEEITEALFIIDMNNGFCDSDCNLGDETIKHIVPNLIETTKYFIENGEGIFVVNDKHDKSSVELKRFPGHCDNEYESRTIKELEICERYAIKTFYKNSTCAIFAPGVMDTLLEMKKLKRVVLAGCCTDICIMNFAIALRNFFDELNLDIEIIVPKNVVETFHNEGHDRTTANEFGYKAMECNGIKLVREYPPMIPSRR
ncbi:MAG: cysteine hydrolase [Ruminococcus sp.]|nr:cysteine hydrolase [Ruminococcus sp.]